MNWIMIVLFHPEGKVWVDFSIHTNSCGKKQQPFSPYFSSVMCTAHLSPPTQKKTCFSHKLFYLYSVTTSLWAGLSAYCDRKRIQILNLWQ